jgi:RHS repeat-associated protein
MPGLSLSYDYDNRLSWTSTEGGYSYDPDNRRMFKSATSAEQVYFYGVDGRKLGTYQVNWDLTTIQTVSENLHFAGRLIRSNNNWVVTDRLGSVVRSGTETLRYFPWGEERTTTAHNRDKFGTYFRDASGLDYALNRYYSSSHGRFLTVDTGKADVGSPQSFNRYAYALHDPVNQNDPSGLVPCRDLVVAGTGATLGQLTASTTDSGLLAQLVWAEGAAGTDATIGTAPYYVEREAIAMSVLNRWAILNGAITISRVPDVATLGWGPANAIQNVLNNCA